MSDSQKVTMDKFSLYIHNKRDLFEAAQRNGFYLPNYSSSIVTEDYITKVIKGDLWCPQYKEIRLLPCVKPPSKDILMEKLGEVLSKQNRNGGFTENRSPDKQWIIHLLSTFSPKDEIFDKNYLPPAKPEISKSLKSVEIPFSFLKGLPISKKRQKRTRLQIVKSGKREIEKFKIKEAHDKLSRSILEVEQDVQNRSIQNFCKEYF